MYLKSLEIQGFKSFAERTRIDVHQGVTAIIGPNGSGKSNVTDAIRWVLGEQSARALRGGKMEDVIFAGTGSRRPLSYAEVTMILDNGDQSLPVDYSEVAVTRRLYRSGESQFLINKQPVRLKDIHALFMDTGLGKDGYSIISQGRVDEILSNKSEDRRRIFEEASGIQRYKSRRDEALRRLEHSSQNLLRVQDILGELEGRIKPLERQAEKARRYLELYDELRTKDITLSLHSIEEGAEKLRRAQQQTADLELQWARCLEEGRDLEERHAQIREEQASLQSQFSAEEEADTQRQGRTEALNQRRTQIRERQAALEEAQRQSQNRQEEVLARKAELEQELAGELGLRAQRESQQEALRAELESLEAGQDQRQQEIQALNRGLQERQQDLRILEEQYLRLRSEMGETSVREALMQEQKDGLQTAQKENEAELADLHQRLEEAGQEQDRLLAEDQKLRQTFAEEEQRLEAAKIALEQSRKQYNQLVSSLDQKQYQLQSLEQQERNHEGYPEAVRQILKRGRERAELQLRIFGTVAENLSVDKNYETAIETALGSALNQVLVADAETARELIDILKRERLGRVTFLPIDRVRPTELAPDLRQKLERLPASTYLGTAFSQVQYAPEHEAVYRYLLGRVLLAPDLAAANELARQTRQALRIVTLEGEVIAAGGSITGGQYRRKGISFLARRREIESLEEEIKRAEKLLDQAEQAIDEGEEATAEAAQRRDAVNRQAMQQAEQLLRQGALARQLEAERQRLDQQRQSLEERCRQLAEEEAQRRNSAGNLEQALQANEARQAELRTEIKAKGELIESLLEGRQAEQEQYTELRSRVLAFEHETQQQAQLKQRLEAEIERLVQRQRELLIQDEEQSQEQQRLQAEAQQIQQDLEHLEQQRQREEEQRQRLGAALARLNQRSEELFAALRRQSEEQNALDSERQRLIFALEQGQEQLDRLKNHLWETYSLTADHAAQFRDPELEADLRATEERLKALREEVRGLGHVNVNAVEEFKELKERRDFLAEQEADIQAAEKELRQLIQELTGEMREIFAERFAQINQHFQEVFQELFGGGQAEISLLGDGDILEAEIQIKASPPGKKLQNMLLLSGGERSLAAIALLFAILKLRPTPFCVLDEIEAALDDSNVFRFTNFIRHYSKQSQFILVTHRKGTMESADSIYGVTMQERGVSRILSMRLADQD